MNVLLYVCIVQTDYISQKRANTLKTLLYEQATTIVCNIFLTITKMLQSIPVFKIE